MSITNKLIVAAAGVAVGYVVGVGISKYTSYRKAKKKATEESTRTPDASTTPMEEMYERKDGSEEPIDVEEVMSKSAQVQVEEVEDTLSPAMERAEAKRRNRVAKEAEAKNNTENK